MNYKKISDLETYYDENDENEQMIFKIIVKLSPHIETLHSLLLSRYWSPRKKSTSCRTNNFVVIIFWSICFYKRTDWILPFLNSYAEGNSFNFSILQYPTGWSKRNFKIAINEFIICKKRILTYKNNFKTLTIKIS